MKKIADFVIRSRRAVLAVFAVLTVVGVLGALTLHINYNMADYLPPKANSTLAIDAMASEFDGQMPNATIMMKADSIAQTQEQKAALLAIDGVSSVTWLDDSVDVKMPLASLDPVTVASYYKDGQALYSVTIENGKEADAVKAIYDYVGDDGSVVGSAVDQANSQNLAAAQSASCGVIIGPLLILIMIIATCSWIEPLIYLAAVVISILLSLGMASFAGDLSYVSQSVIPLLQLAVALDYAVFLSTAYTARRRETADCKKAMKQALVDSSKPIFASMLVAVFAFATLIFMDFGIGADMGWALVRGVCASYVCVIALVPSLMIACDGLIQKTTHRRFLPSFKKLGLLLTKIRIPALVLIVAIAIPCFFAQGNNDFLYGGGSPTEGSRIATDTQKIQGTFGDDTTLALLVPRGNSVAESDVCTDIQNMPGVESVTSYVTEIGNKIPPEYLGSLSSNFYSNDYARIIVRTSTGSEGPDAFNLVKNIRNCADSYYGSGNSLMCGESANTYDMMKTVNADGARVDILTIVAIFIVLALVFRSLIIPIIALLAIKAAIFINMAVPYFLGDQLSYIGYLVVSVVMMGSAIDYGILLIDHYLEERKRAPRIEAMTSALPQAIPAMVVSALILAIAGLALSFASSEPLVKDLGMLLGRGAIIAFIMSVTLLPALLVLCDKLIPKLSFGIEFYREDTGCAGEIPKSRRGRIPADKMSESIQAQA